MYLYQGTYYMYISRYNGLIGNLLCSYNLTSGSNLKTKALFFSASFFKQ